MEKEFKVIMDIDECEALERLHMEYNYSKDVVQRILETHTENASILDSESFKEYNKRAAEKFAEYEIMKSNVELKYLPEELKGKNYSWAVDFEDATINYTLID